MYVTLLFSFVLISILCPWSFNCWNMLNFSYFCVISVWTWCYAHMQLLTILICFMQVRCIVRNIVRDWAEEVIFCSTDMNIEKYCCFIYLFIYLFYSRVKRNVMSATSLFSRSLIVFFLTGAMEGKPCGIVLCLCSQVCLHGLCIHVCICCCPFLLVDVLMCVRGWTGWEVLLSVMDYNDKKLFLMSIRGQNPLRL
jgi:hypothetical protein